VVKRVRDGGSLGFDNERVVAAMVMNGGAKVKCAITVVMPAWSGVGAEMSDTQLARGVEGMGTKVKFVAMQSVEGGDFSRGGDGGVQERNTLRVSSAAGRRRCQRSGGR
jgi:hypothetical protein